MKKMTEEKPQATLPVYAYRRFHSRLKLLAAFEQTEMRDVLEYLSPEIEKRLAVHLNGERK
jgi:hypothetical protein